MCCLQPASPRVAVKQPAAAAAAAGTNKPTAASSQRQSNCNQQRHKRTATGTEQQDDDADVLAMCAAANQVMTSQKAGPGEGTGVVWPQSVTVVAALCDDLVAVQMGL